MATVLKVPDLLDLALSGNEINSKCLLAALQALSQHLNLSDVKVEFRGSDSDQIQAYINESTDEKIRAIPVTVKTSSQINQPQSTHPSQMTVDTGGGGIPTTGIMGSETSSFENRDKKLLEPVNEDVIVIQGGRVHEPGKKRFVSSGSFTRLENKVKSLQGQLEALSTQVLPTDEILLESTRSHQESKPITDMWQGLNITKRMSGAEEGIDKLASLLETVAKEYAELRTVIEKIQQEFGDDVGETLQTIKTVANYAKQIKPREQLFGHIQKKEAKSKTYERASSPRAPPDPPSSQSETDDGESDTQTKSKGSKKDDVEEDRSSREFVRKIGGEQIPSRDLVIPQGEGPFKELVSDLTAVLQLIPENEEVSRVKVNNILVQHERMKNALEQTIAQVNTLADVIDVVLPDLVKEIPHMEGIRKKLAELRVVDDQTCSAASLSLGEETKFADKGNLAEKLKDLEARQSKYAAKVKRQEYMLCEKTLEYDLRLSDLMKSIQDISNGVEELTMKQNPVENETREILDKIKGLEEAMVEVGCSTQELQEDAEQKNILFETLASELELLKTAKADRFELEAGLSEKANCDALKKKVGMDIFEVACTDLSKGIDEALNRISLQENLLSTVGPELQSSINSKLNKADVDAIKGEIDDRILLLAKEVERIASVKDGKIAAGAKKKYLAAVNCISCDRIVSMKTDPEVPSIPALADFPSRKTVRPYVTYELDYLRRMRNKDPEVEKYITYEELAKRYQIKNLESFENLEKVPHLETRYCGGSHTVVGPQQKVVHTGHFQMREDPYHRK